MSAVHKLITDHLDIWTAADTEKKSGRGRASGNANSVYGIKKLRELILELAVRGKLVPQDPNDEPACELLKRISANQDKSIRPKKKKEKEPQIENESLTKSISLPSGWAFAYIPQIVSGDKYAIKRGPFGSSIQKSHFVLSGYKVYEQQHAIKDDFSIGDYYVTKEKFEELRAFSIKPNDIIISCSGTVGKVAVAPSWMEPGIINQALLKLTLNENALTNAYFKILFPAFYMRTETLSNLKGTAQKNMVSVDELKNEPFPLPPLAEQHRIVAKVDELMALCDQLEAQHNNADYAHEQLVSHLLSTLTRSQDATDFNANWQRIATHFDTLFTTESSIDFLKQTLLQLAVTGKLVPQDPNDEPAIELLKRIKAEKAKLVAGEIMKDKLLPEIGANEIPIDLPDGWQLARLNNLTKLITKGSSPKWQGVNYSDNPQDILFVTSENVGSYTLLLDSPKYVEQKFNEIEPRSILAKGDFLMNIVGASIGRTAIYNLDTLANINQAVCLIRVLTSNLNDQFLLHFFNSETCLKYMFDKQVDNARPNLSMGNIAKFVIPLPPLAEQNRIVAKLEQLISICNQLQNKVQANRHIQIKIADALMECAIQ